MPGAVRMLHRAGFGHPHHYGTLCHRTRSALPNRHAFSSVYVPVRTLAHYGLYPGLRSQSGQQAVGTKGECGEHRLIPLHEVTKL